MDHKQSLLITRSTINLWLGALYIRPGSIVVVGVLLVLAHSCAPNRGCRVKYRDFLGVDHSIVLENDMAMNQCPEGSSHPARRSCSRVIMDTVDDR